MDGRTDEHKSGRTFYHNSASLTNEHVETCNKELKIKSRINKFHNEPLLCFHIIPFYALWILLIGSCAKYVLRCPLHVESDLRCVLQRHNVSLANIRDWNANNICLFYYFYALYGIFISSGGYFIVNKGVLRCPIQVERPPIINMCTPKT